MKSDLLTSPVRLELHHEDTCLSSATGFLFEHGTSFPLNTYLVTNWHVVSGRHAFTNRPLRIDCAIPNRIRAFITVKSRGKNSWKDVLYGDETLRIDIPLYDGDNDSSMDNPNWREHPMGSVCDVAAIDITGMHRDFCARNVEFDYNGDTYEGEVLHKPLETRRNGLLHGGLGGRIPLESPLSYDSELVISGFPRLAMAPLNFFPLLKRGVVSSPPDAPLIYRNKELPAFYADVMTREGFSGSPVFFKQTSLNTHEIGRMGDSYHSVVPTHATQEYTFVGIYSSRMPEDESNELIYGTCWHREAIASVCENKAQAKNPVLV